MPNTTDNELNRHRRPKPDAFKTKENATPWEKRIGFFKARRTDIASSASSVTAIFLTVNIPRSLLERNRNRNH